MSSETIVLTKDGDQWCALFGEDLQVGVAGFGDTRAEAVHALAFALADHEQTPVGHLAPYTVEQARECEALRAVERAARDVVDCAAHGSYESEGQAMDALRAALGVTP